MQSKAASNALVESKNGTVIRKHLGYGHIPGRHAERLNRFNREVLSPYLNYHRPCWFASEELDEKGRVRRRYRQANLMTPYEKLKSLPQAASYLREGVDFAQLDAEAHAMSDNEAARRLNAARLQAHFSLESARFADSVLFPVGSSGRTTARAVGGGGAGRASAGAGMHAGGGLRVKRDSGWFAAGEGFERALERLSDGAFKVFAYVCLHAERSSGRMAFERAELARSVGKSRSALGRCLRELVHKGVCTLEAAPNQHRSSQLQVQAAYWPYEPGTGSARRPAADAVRGQAAYVESVREMFRKPRCVRGPFGPGDERLAAAWHAAGVPLETVRRALLLGCVRKSMTLMDHPSQPLIASLAYFEGVLEEVREQSFPAGYWQHLEFNLDRCEQYWQAESDKAPGSARPISGQAGRPAGVRRPPSHLRGDREERRDDDGLSHQSTGL